MDKFAIPAHLLQYEQIIQSFDPKQAWQQAQVRRRITTTSVYMHDRITRLQDEPNDALRHGFLQWLITTEDLPPFDPPVEEFVDVNIWSKPDESLADDALRYQRKLDYIYGITADHASRLAGGILCALDVFGPPSEAAQAERQRAVRGFGATIGYLAVVLQFCEKALGPVTHNEAPDLMIGDFGDEIHTEALINQILHINSLLAGQDERSLPEGTRWYSGFQQDPKAVEEALAEGLAGGLTKSEAQSIIRQSPARTVILVKGAAGRKKTGRPIQPKLTHQKSYRL